MIRNAIVVLFSICSISFAQGINALTIAASAPLRAKVGTTVDARLPLQVLNGYHVQSNTPSDPYLIALKLTWNPGPLESTGVTYPKPQM